MSETQTTTTETQTEQPTEQPKAEAVAPIEGMPKVAAGDDKGLDRVKQIYASNPDLMPEQFEGNVDKLIEAYKAAQVKITEQGQQISELKADETDESSQGETTDGTSESEEVERLEIPQEEKPAEGEANPVWDELRSEFTATGKLSDETKTKLANDLKMPAELVSYFEQSLQAKQKEDTTIAAEMVGGMDNLKSILNWAKSLDPAEQVKINQGLQGENAEYVLRGLAARWMADSGKDAQSKAQAQLQTGQVKGGDVANAKNQANPYSFNIPADPRERVKYITNLMRDPKYKTDPNYREAVGKAVAGNDHLQVKTMGRGGKSNVGS